MSTKEKVEVNLMREQARFWWSATNFLRWMRREFTHKPIDQAALDERVQGRILPHVRTIGGSLYNPQETPLSVWRKAIALAEQSR